MRILRQEASTDADETLADMLVCAWCKRVRKHGTWRRRLFVPTAFVSHGICPHCFEREVQRLGNTAG